MKKLIAVLMISTVGLYGCTTNPTADIAAPVSYTPAVQTTQQSVASQTNVSSEALVTSPAAFLAQQTTSDVKAQKILTGVAAVKEANKKALKQPDSNAYQNGIMTYDFVPGALYKIYCAPLNVTDIQFQPGETLVSVAAGDTLRWQVSKTYSGSGEARREHLMVKPTDSNIQDSVVVTTSQHAYHLMMYSTNSVYMATVRWRYPGETDLAQNFGEEGDVASNSVMGAGGVNVSQMDFNYRADILEGSRPDWVPTMIFNDGHKTYIQLPDNVQDSPTLFVGSDATGGEQVVNYRIVGNYYIVDRVVYYAQLRSGQTNSTIVQISYGDNSNAR